MKILVTAGPTREPIDPARFISNESTGKMGYAVAEASRDRGHQTVLISGPVSLEAPAGIRVVRIRTALQMKDAVADELSSCDALVMAAAVCDWRPAVCSSRKISKSDIQSSLELAPNPDILENIKGLKGERIFVGFAAETRDILKNARSKLSRKGLDMIVANSITGEDSAFGSDSNRITMLDSNGAVEELPLMSKKIAGIRIIEWIEKKASIS